MSNNIYYHQTNPNDTGTKYRVSTMVSTTNVVDGTSALVNNTIATYYGNFPTKSNIPINNANFDLSSGIIGYKINGVDLGNSFPAAVDYYTTTSVRNTFTLYFTNNISDDPANNSVFNASATNNVEIEKCFNHISVIVCGGGGGGGHSKDDSSGGHGGQGGGGGGWCSVDRINLTNTGRSFSVTRGGEGSPGIPYQYRTPYSSGLNYSAIGGGYSRIISNNTGVFARANGGGAGISSAASNANGLGGNSVSNFGFLLNVDNPTATTNNMGTNNGNDNSPASQGGACTYNERILKNSGIATQFNHARNAYMLANNSPGTPGGGVAANVVYTVALQGNVTYNKVLNAKGGGGGGASGNNAGDQTGRPGHPGAPGAPGYVIIYKYMI